MPVDTRRKRQSAAACGQVWFGPPIVPDGSFDQGDRQSIGWSYYGILAATPAVGQGPYWNKMYIGTTIGH